MFCHWQASSMPTAEFAMPIQNLLALQRSKILAEPHGRRFAVHFRESCGSSYRFSCLPCCFWFILETCCSSSTRGVDATSPRMSWSHGCLAAMLRLKHTCISSGPRPGLWKTLATRRRIQLRNPTNFANTEMNLSSNDVLHVLHSRFSIFPLGPLCEGKSWADFHTKHFRCFVPGMAETIAFLGVARIQDQAYQPAAFQHGEHCWNKTG